MGVNKECYLQVNTETDYGKGSLEFLKTEKFWTIEEIENSPKGFSFSSVVIKFKSQKDRRRFVHLFTEKGRMLSRNSYIVRWSKWPNIPFGGLKSAIELQDMNSYLNDIGYYEGRNHWIVGE